MLWPWVILATMIAAPHIPAPHVPQPPHLLLAPLPPQIQDDLNTATDGSDHREQAFFTLIEHVRSWSEHSPFDSENRAEQPLDQVDWQHTLEHPGEYRGRICRVNGELLQASLLAPPYEDVAEWFVRDELTGQPIVAYLVTGADFNPPRERTIVSVVGRFYKSVRFTARDGVVRDYPALVSSTQLGVQVHAASLPSRSRESDRLFVLGSVVAALLIAFAVVRIWIARLRRHTFAREGHTRGQVSNALVDAKLDDAAALPDDPAEALAELRRRARS